MESQEEKADDGRSAQEQRDRSSKNRSGVAWELVNPVLVEEAPSGGTTEAEDL